MQAVAHVNVVASELIYAYAVLVPISQLVRRRTAMPRSLALARCCIVLAAG